MRRGSDATWAAAHHVAMRILVTAAPAIGHLLPVLPVAAAAAARGHDVLVATGIDLGPVIERAGLRHHPMGPPSLDAAFGRIDGLTELTGQRRVVRLVSEGFAGMIADAFADGILDLATGWRPDLVVHEDMEMGSWIAAERMGIPHVVIQATAWRPPIRRIAASAQATIRARHGLPEDPELAGQDGALWFTTRPPTLRDSGIRWPSRLRELRSDADDRLGARGPGARGSGTRGSGGAGNAEPELRDWLSRDAGRPRVAVTLGTVNADRLDLFRAILDGLADLDVEVVVALGRDPATLGAVPANARVEAYVPMSELLPRSAFVVHHAGSGTMLAALAAGRPMVLVPIAADQPDTAIACVAAGVAIRLDSTALAADDVRTAAVRLLDEPAFAQRALLVAAEIAAMPDATAAVTAIEDLV